MNRVSVRRHKQVVPHSQAGLTLVELLIALALSGLLISGAIKIVQSNKATLTLIESFVQAQETGRFSLEVLSRDIRMAGYSGCVNTMTKVTSMLDETDAEYDANLHSFANSITAIDSYDSSVHASSYGGVTPVAGSDVFISRGAVSTDLLVSKTPAATAANFHVYGPQSQLDLITNNVSEGMVLFVTNCSEGHIFAVSNTTTGGAGINIVHNSSVTGGPDNTSNSFGVAYESGSSVLMMNNVTYFIAPSDIADGATNSLYRYSTLEEGGKAIELMPFIEDLVFTYGVDIDEDHYVDQYVTGDQLNNLAYSLAYDSAYAETYANQIGLGMSETDAIAAAELAGEAAGNTAQANSSIEDYVISVRVEIVTVGEKDVGAAQLAGFADDGKLRKRFTRVVHVRNAGIGNGG